MLKLRKPAASLPPTVQSEVDRIGAITDVKQLLEELARKAEDVLHSIITVAAIVRRLNELGADISDIHISGLATIKRIAYGQTIPELFVALRGSPYVLGKAERLPRPEQEAIAADEPIKVMEVNGGSHRLVAPSKLSRTEAMQVFAQDHIRDDAEQISWLRDKERQALLKGQVKRTFSEPITIDLRRKLVIVNQSGYALTASEMARYVAQLTERQ